MRKESLHRRCSLPLHVLFRGIDIHARSHTEAHRDEYKKSDHEAKKRIHTVSVLPARYYPQPSPRVIPTTYPQNQNIEASRRYRGEALIKAVAVSVTYFFPLLARLFGLDLLSKLGLALSLGVFDRCVIFGIRL